MNRTDLDRHCPPYDNAERIRAAAQRNPACRHCARNRGVIVEMEIQGQSIVDPYATMPGFPYSKGKTRFIAYACPDCSRSMLVERETK